MDREILSTFFFNYFMRNLTKTIYKLIKPRDYKHNRRYWPFYYVERNASGQIDQVFFRKQLIANHRLPIVSKNSKCMLITTGPSIQDMPSSIFSQTDIDYIGVNGAIALNNVHFKHYVIIDHDFIKNRFDLVKRVLNTECNFFTTARCLDIILQKLKLEEIACKFKVIEIVSSGKNELFLGKTMYVNEHSSKHYFYNGFGFSEHIHDTIFDYHTVAYTALQIIAGLKYPEIYIAGLDMNNFSSPRFYETAESKQPTFLDQNTESILAAFQTAALFFESKKIRVYNLSKQSLIEVFIKLDTAVIFNDQQDDI